MRIRTKVELEVGDAIAIADVKIPKGYRRVWTGALCPGDLYLDMQALVGGATIWKPVPGKDLVARDNTAVVFGCLIRYGEPVQQACELCGVRPAPFGFRYCEACCPACCGEGA